MIETFIEVELNDAGDFLKVKETLTRIGVASEVKNILWQSCHILHKRGKLYIVHFKELFALDEIMRAERNLPPKNKETTISDEDIARRNTIANLLQEWGLVKIVNPEICNTPRTQIRVLPFKEKGNWTLIAKYSIGNRGKRNDRQK